MASRGNVANQSGEGRRNVVRNSLVVLAGRGIIRSTGFQPRQGGDMACIRGPLGACVATLHNVDDSEGRIHAFLNPSLAIVVEKHRNRRIRDTRKPR